MSKKCPPGTLCFESGLVFTIIIILVIVGGFLYFNNQNKMNDNSTDTDISNQEIQNLKNDFIVEKNKTQQLNEQVQQIQTQNIIKQNNLFKQNNINQSHNSLDNPLFIVDRTYERSTNPFLPPLRSNPNEPATSVSLRGLGVPINIPTRGYSQDYQQVGVLTGGDKILPLFGRTTWSGSNKWLYYTSSDQFHTIKLPVKNKKRDCTQEFGCDELYDKDSVFVPAYNKEFEVSIYQLDAPRYIPYV